MKVIYYCYGSSHSSVLAAAIHTGKLPTMRVATKDEICQLPHYDKTDSNEIGTPFYYGEDEFNNQIYVLGMGSKRELVKSILFSFLNEVEISTNDIIVIDALPYVNLATKVGGILSRRFGLVKIGRPLTIYSLQLCYNRYIKLIERVKKRLKQIDRAD